MLLVIDVGNSDLSFGLSDLGDLCAEKLILERARFSTSTFRHESDRNIILKSSLEAQLSQLDHVTNILIACVVPTMLSAVREFCDTHLKCSALVMGEGHVAFPSQALVDDPTEVGADLRVNAYAAHAFYRGPALVVGCGTATTFSGVNDQGDFCGTAIAPGMGLLSQALPRVATHLPQIHFKKPPSPLGLNTVEAMESGLFWGQISLVEGVINRIQHQMCLTKELDFTKPFKVIATGGYAPLIAPHCPSITIIDDDLTLKGLALIFKTKLKGK